MQPKSAIFILTGYPDFQTALEAIRKQVDDYFTKPADIPTLVSTLHEKVRTPRLCGEPSCKRVSNIVLENSDGITRRWLNEVKIDHRLTAVPVSDKERIDKLPLLLRDVAKALDAKPPQIPPQALSAAAVHGSDRARQGYTIPLMVAEMRILNRIIGDVLQENLLTINLSSLVPEALTLESTCRQFWKNRSGHSRRRRSHRKE